MDGSCKAYGESLLHSKKQVEHERLRLAKTVGRLTNSYKGTYKRRQTHRFCSCIDGPLKAPPLTLFHYMRTRPVVNNCILTPSFTFQPRIRAEGRGIVIYQTLLSGMRVSVSACAYISRSQTIFFHESSKIYRFYSGHTPLKTAIRRGRASVSHSFTVPQLLRSYPLLS